MLNARLTSNIPFGSLAFKRVDLIKIAIDQGTRMATYTLPNDDEWQGVNTPEQLAEANKKMEGLREERDAVRTKVDSLLDLLQEIKAP